MTGMVKRGVCYGFEVHSGLDFEYLRSGSGAVLEVTEASKGQQMVSGDLIQEWAAIPGKRARTRLGLSGEDYTVEIGDRDRFYIDRAGSTMVMSRTAEPRRRELRLWTTPAALGMVKRGDLALHAASVEVGDRAVLIVAPTGFGKTTTAAAFGAAGARVLADDMSGVRTAEHPSVIPGPPVLRIKQDTVDHLDLTGLYEAAHDGHKVHLGIDASKRGDGSPVTLAGIVFLRPGRDSLEITQADPKIALRDLWSMSFYLPDEESRAECFRKLAALVASVPAWDLARALELSTLPHVIDGIEEVISSG